MVNDVRATFPRFFERVTIGEWATPYAGHHRLMAAQPNLARRTKDTIARLTAGRWAALFDVQRRVNAALTPRADGPVDVWTSGEEGDRPGVGDCDDYTMRKRFLLAKAAFPLGSLLPFVVDAPAPVGLHAVLLVRTDRGHLILDNLHADPMPWVWLRERYKPLKIVSPAHSAEWREAS